MAGLGTGDLLWWTHLTWIVFLLNARNGLAVTPICSAGVAGRCFQVDAMRLSWAEADQACTSRGGSLAKVGSQSDQNTIAGYAGSKGVFSLWLGGKVTDSDWIWAGNKHRHIRYLGCYRDTGNNPDLEYAINNVVNYPSQCVQACSNYKYSSVQFDNNNRVKCRCGNSYGKHGRKHEQQCEKLCTPQPPTATFQNREREALDRFCGNPGFQIVTRVLGLDFHAWVGPGAQRNDDCVAMDGKHQFRWKDFHCTSQRAKHLCEYGTKQQSSCTSPKVWLSKGASGDGICISKHTSNKNWFNAKLDCKDKGGYLLEIRDHVVQDLVTNMLYGTDDRYWIGLNKRTWSWRDGSIIDRYSAWATSQPQPTDKTTPTCLMMGMSYNWVSADCGTTHPFVCEYMNGAPSTGPGPQPPPGPQPTPLPSLPPGKTNQPPNDPNRQGGQISPAIIGGAAGGGAVLLIIVVVVVCCCCRKKSPPKKPMSKGHQKPPRDTRPPRGDKPPGKPSSRPLPTAPGKTLVGHDNKAITLEHTKPLGGGAKANTYVQGRQAPPPAEEEYLALENPYATKPSVYEPLDKGPAVYEDIIYDKPVDVYEDYIDMSQGMTKPNYDNVKESAKAPPRKESSYTNYLKPTR